MSSSAKPSTKPVATINDLPTEMISELFKYLRLKDLVTCSLVNKHWHSIYADFRVNSLMAIGDSDYEFAKWSHPNRKIEVNERCHLKRFSRLLEMPLLSNLKRLALGDESPPFDLNKLNGLDQLVHLQINVDRLENVHLNLPRLKVLAFRFQKVEHWSLSVDCPELNVLAYRGKYRTANLPDVKHPETIRFLEADTTNLSPFQNVECLVTREFEVICKDTLLSLPRLNELRYDVDINAHFGDFGYDTLAYDNTHDDAVDRMKRMLREFLEDARTIRGPDFRFKFAGFKLNELELDNIDFSLQVIEGSEDDEVEEIVHNEVIYMKNYRLLDTDGTLDFIRFVNYSLLVQNAVGEFPTCFSEKFTGIEYVRVDAVEDESHLLWFLRSLRALRRLDIANVFLSEGFYDKLPASARSLTELIFYGNDWNDFQLNFDFINSFSHLSHLRIHGIVSVESLFPLIRHLVKLRSGHFDFRLEKRFSIWKFKSNEYQVRDFSCGYKILLSTKHSDEIVNYLEKLQSDSAKKEQPSEEKTGLTKRKKF